MGNISRGMIDKAYSKTRKYKWKEVGCNSFLKLISEQLGHYFQCCEAFHLQDRDFLNEMEIKTGH